MAKPELEFFRPADLPWRPVAGSATAGAGGPGVTQKILSRDPATDDVTRLLRFEPGAETSGTIAHDFWEEVWNQTFGVGMYACRPPTGALLFEIRYRR